MIFLFILDYNKKSKDIIKLLNDFRKNPKSLSRHLEGLKKYIDKSKVLTEPGKIPIQMVEGEDVINEAIQFLNSLKPLAPFELDPFLCESAKEHVNDIGPKGLLSYQSSDGTEPEDRIAKYGNYVEALGENIDFGPNDSLGVIVSLTLDDGEDERPHRDNLFKSDYRKIGIACGAHKTEYQMCVMDFAFDFVPSNQNQEVNMNDNMNNNMNNEEEEPVMNNNMNNMNNNENKLSSKPNTGVNSQGQLNYPNNISNNSNQNNMNNNNNMNVQPEIKMQQGGNQINQDYNNMNVSKQGQQINPAKQIDNNVKYNNYNQNQSPIVPVILEKNTNLPNTQVGNSEVQNIDHNEIAKINSKKKMASKFVEITTKTIITFEDGSKKEVVETDNHTFLY